MSLSIGDKAPSFSCPDQEGTLRTLEEFKGQKLVLYFYPKDQTPGCIKEACNLRDNYNLLLSKGYAILGVSVDDETSHQKFIAKHELPFSLLADTQHKVVEAYAVWKEKNMYGRKFMGIVRTTFVINEEGIIEEIINKVKTDAHAEQILND